MILSKIDNSVATSDFLLISVEDLQLSSADGMTFSPSSSVRAFRF